MTARDGSLRIALFFNSMAGRGRASKARDAIIREVKSRTRDVVVVDSRSREQMTNEVAGAAGMSFDRIVICGGDGTLHHAIQRADLDRVTFGIVPLGSGDDYAQAVGIPRDHRAAIDRVFHGSLRFLDVGLVNGTRFLGAVSVGFDATVAERAATMRFRPRSALYAAAVFREIFSFRPFVATIRAGEASASQEVMFVVVANSSRYGGGINIAPGAKLDDGLLDLVIVGRASKLDLLLTFPAAYRGHHLRKRFVRSLRTCEAVIETEQPRKIFADGESAGTTPAKIEIAAKRLRLVV